MKLTKTIVALLVAWLTVPALAQAEETLKYRWHLGGFFGTLARVFLPGSGNGELSTRQLEAGNLEVELDITAPDAKGEFWRYGAEIDAADGRTLRAWSSYQFRGRGDENRSEFDEEAVIDIVSGITLLRRERPQETRLLRIWNDGKIYPISIIPRDRVTRKVNGKRVVARHYAIRARRVPNERLWKGRLDIYLAEDAAATPIEISLERRMARVRLLLDGAGD